MTKPLDCNHCKTGREDLGECYSCNARYASPYLPKDERINAALDAFCRLQCHYGPDGAECLDCLLLEHRNLNDRERRALVGCPGRLV